MRHKAKTGAAHHTKVAEEEGPPPELAKAEELIQKQDFAGAEPLLQKVLEGDAEMIQQITWRGLSSGLSRMGSASATSRSQRIANP